MRFLIKKKNKKQSIFNWLMFHLHLWFGLLSAIVVFVMCFSGAAVVLEPQIVELANWSKAYNKEKVEKTCSLDEVVTHYETNFGAQPGKIIIPKSKGKNIQIYTSGHRPIITYYDRATGEMLGESSDAYNKFFSFMMQGHRRMFMNNKTGGRLISWGNVLFLILLISGVILWFPRGKKQIKARFKILLPKKFKSANYRIHVNWGFYTTLGLFVMSFTGICFSFNTIHQATINLFRSGEERKEMSEVQKDNNVADEMDALFDQFMNTQKEEEKTISYDELIKEANKILDYKAEIQLTFPGMRSPEFTVTKINTHNLLGAHLSDNVYFSDKGEMTGSSKFADLKTSQKVGMLIYPLHTGDILGFKSQLLYFVLCLIGAWFPVSGFIMWWNRIRPRKKSKHSRSIERIPYVNAL